MFDSATPTTQESEVDDFFRDLDSQEENDFTYGVGGLLDSLSPKHSSKGPKTTAEAAEGISLHHPSSAKDSTEGGQVEGDAQMKLRNGQQEMEVASASLPANLGSSDGTYWGTYDYTSVSAQEARHADALAQQGQSQDQAHDRDQQQKVGTSNDVRTQGEGPLNDLGDRISVAERRLEGVRSGVEDSVHAARTSIRANEMRTTKLVKRLHTEIESLKKRLRAKDADLSRVGVPKQGFCLLRLFTSLNPHSFQAPSSSCRGTEREVKVT